MESHNKDADIGDKFSSDEDLSSQHNKHQFDLNHTKNIDDISTPSELKFDQEFEYEDPDITEKRKEIEKSLLNPDTVNLETWQYFAKSKGGLISDEYRRKIWPLLVGVTEDEMTEPPSLDELSTHSEYNQVVLDVNRSLKRFPPGIPYEQRVALQDQLTVLILRVIIQYPHLKYYQGYHDVAITLLLVCGEKASFPLLCRLSHGPAAPLAPFMQTTMQPTQHLLNYMLPVIATVDKELADYMDKRGHDVRAAVVPDVVRAQPGALRGRGAAVRLLPVRGAAAARVRHGGAGAAPRTARLRLRLRHGHGALHALQATG